MVKPPDLNSGGFLLLILGIIKNYVIIIIRRD